MSELQQDLSREPKAAPTPDTVAVDTALDKARDLPFFDLDIALIRRGQQPSAAQPAPERSRERKTPVFNRERQALDALEALLAERATPARGAPVPLFPQAAPAPAAKTEPKYIEPRVMPVAAPAQVSAGFVSPGFERVTVAPVTEAGEPLATLSAALLQTASDVTAQATDLLPELKLQLVRQALARREALFIAQPVMSKPAPAISAPPIVGDVNADDLPWGHVTYRLLVM